MSALFVLIGISILVAGCFLVVFLWSVSDGQYEDDYTPSVRILFDDDIEVLTIGDNKDKNRNNQNKL